MTNQQSLETLQDKLGNILDGYAFAQLKDKNVAVEEITTSFRTLVQEAKPGRVADNISSTTAVTDYEWDHRRGYNQALDDYEAQLLHALEGNRE